MSEECKKSEDLLENIDEIACAYRDNLEVQYQMFRRFASSFPKKKKKNQTTDVYTTVKLPKTIDEKENKIDIYDFFTLLHDFLGSHKKTDGWNKKERDNYVSDYLTDDDKKLLEKTLYLGIPTLSRQKTALLRTWFNNKNELTNQYKSKASEFNEIFLSDNNIKTKLEPADLAQFITHFPSPTAAATTFLYFLFPNQFIPYDDNTKKSVDTILMDGDACCCGCEKDGDSCNCTDEGCWQTQSILNRAAIFKAFHTLSDQLEGKKAKEAVEVVLNAINKVLNGEGDNNENAKEAVKAALEAIQNVLNGEGDNNENENAKEAVKAALEAIQNVLNGEGDNNENAKEAVKAALEAMNIDNEWKNYLEKINCLHCCWKKHVLKKLCLECCATLSEDARTKIDEKIPQSLPESLPTLDDNNTPNAEFLNQLLPLENGKLFNDQTEIDPTQAAIYILGKYLEKNPSAWDQLKDTAVKLCEKCSSKEAGGCCLHWIGAYANLSDYCFDPAQTIALVFYAYVAHDNVLDKVLGKVLSQDLSNDDIAVSNVILSGIPGSGKTHAVMEYVKNHKNVGKYEIVQFHPSYDYEDFIEGLKPLPGGRKKRLSRVCGGQNDDGGLSFRLVNGVFKQLCKEAYENWIVHNNRKFYVMVIDEINRANLSRVFGELLYCLEYRDAWVETKFTNYIKALPENDKNELSIARNVNENDVMGKFNIPKNVVIVGTMNDVDRSIDAFDLALRRRFVWEEIGYTPYHLYVYDKFIKKMNPQHIVRLVSRATALNKELEKEFGPDFMIGHTYFYKAANYYDEKNKENDETLEKALTQLWDFHLYSLLREYAKMKFAIEDLEGKLGDLRKIFVKEDDGA